MVGRCYATGSVSRSLGLASGTIAPDSLADFIVATYAIISRTTLP